MSYTEKYKEKSNKRATGTYYEEMARAYLVQNHYKILCMNYRTKRGEIDIIAQEGSYIVFIEVKYKASQAYGYPREAVNYHKRKKILYVAQVFLKTHQLNGCNCRFDVIEILGNQMQHLKNAFGV